MPKIIAVEGHGNLQFGDEWSDAQIDQYVASQFGQPAAPAPAPAPVESQGIWGSFKSGASKGFDAGGIPFYSGGKELVKATGVLRAALAAKEGNATDDQIATLQAYKDEEGRAAAEAANRSTGERIAYGVGRVLGELPGFAGELAATGGIATAGEKAATKAAAAGLKALGTESAYSATRKAAEWAAENTSGRIVRGVAGAAAQTIPARGLEIAAGAAERMTPDYSLEQAPEGTYFTTKKEGDDFLNAAYKSLGDQFIETLSERSGEFLTDMIGAGAKKVGLGKAIDWASGLKQAVANRVAQKYPGILGENSLLDSVRKTTKWNGMFGEMLEERAGEVGKAALGVEDYQPPSMEQLAIEAIGFGLVDAGYNSARLASAMAKSKADSNTKQQLLDAVAQAEAARRKAVSASLDSGLSDVVNTSGAVTPFDNFVDTSKASAARRNDSVTSGINESVDTAGVVSPFDSFLTQARAAAPAPSAADETVAPKAPVRVRFVTPRANSATRRAELEAMMTMPSGYDLPQARRAESVDTSADATMTAQDTGNASTPLDDYRNSVLAKPLNLPDVVAQQYKGISQVLTSYLNGEDVDRGMLQTLQQQAPNLVRQINNRITQGVADRVSPRELKPLAQLSESLNQFQVEFAKDQEFENRTAGQIAQAREISQGEAQDRQRRAAALQDAIAAFSTRNANLRRVNAEYDLGAAVRPAGRTPIDRIIDNKRRRTAYAARSKISPPTDISLPADTGAPSMGGVQTGAPVLSSNGTQKQTSEPAPAPALKSATAKASRRAANPQATQAQGVTPYANQEQSRVEVSGSNQSQGAAQDAKGQSGEVQKPAGKGQPVQQAPAPSQEVAKPQVYKTGETAAVGDWVQIPGKFFALFLPKSDVAKLGSAKILGEIVRIEGGRLFVSLEQLGVKNTSSAKNAGLDLKQQYPVYDASMLSKVDRPKIAEETSRGGRKAILSNDEIIQLNQLMNKASKDLLYDQFLEIQRILDRKPNDAVAKAEMDDLGKLVPNWPVMRLAMEAMHRSEDAEQTIKLTHGEGEFQLMREAVGIYRYEVLKHLKKNLDALQSGEPQTGFSRITIATHAISQARKGIRMLDKLTDNPSQTRNEEEDDAPPADAMDQIAAPSKSSEISAESILSGANRGMLADGVAALIERLEEENDGEKLDESSVRNAVLGLFMRKTTASKMNKAGIYQGEVEGYLQNFAVRMASEIYPAYEQSGVAGVSALIKSGQFRLNASANTVDTGNQSLPAGELTLEQAINTVLQTAPKRSLLRTIAEKLLASGANARVVVLSDDAFNQLGIPNVENEVAFYAADPQVNTIFIRQSARSHDYLVMHEAVHAATVNALRTNPQFAADIGSIRAEAIRVLGTDLYGTKDHGSDFKNLAEFVGEALSNTEFQEALRGIKVGENATLLSRFRRAIANLFGLAGDEVTMLDLIVGLATKEFAANKAVNDAAYMSLVNRYESGDQSVLPEIQRMVDEAAKAAGYKYKGYHASSENFTEFLSRAEQAERRGEEFDYDGYEGGNLGQGFYFTPDIGYAKRFGSPRSFYLKINNLVDAQDPKVRELIDSTYRDLEEEYGSAEQGEVFDAIVSDLNADGVFARNAGGFSNGASEFLVKSSSQAKLSDPITRDENWNVIPLSQRFNPDSNSILYAGREFRSRRAVTEAQSVPGISAEASSTIDRLASTQAATVPASVVSAIGNASDDVKKRLKWLVEQHNASSTLTPLYQLPLNTEEEISQAQEAADGVKKFQQRVEKAIATEQARVDKANDVINKTRADVLSKLSTAQSNASAYSAIADTMLRDYTDYLSAQKSIAGQSNAQLANAINASAEVVRGIRADSNRMRKAMEAMADGIPASELASAQSNSDIVNYVHAHSVLLGKVDQSTIDFLLNPSATGAIPLEKFQRLIPALQLIQKIKADINGAKTTINNFNAAWVAMTGGTASNVSSRQFAQRYAKMDAAKRKAIAEASMLDAQIDREDKTLKNASDTLSILESLEQHRAYQSQLTEAGKLLNILVGDAEGSHAGGKTVYVVGDRKFEITDSVDPVVNDANKVTTLAAIAAIDAELAKNPGPLEAHRLAWMKTKLTLYGHTMSDAALGIGFFDIINRVRVWVPVLRPLIDRMFIFRQMPGTIGSKLRILTKVGMQVAKQIESARANPKFGEAAMNIAADAAIKSHSGMTPEQWDAEVLNELLGSAQESTGRSLRVGDTNIFGHTITKEDMAVAKLQARFSNALYEATKGMARGGISMYFPTLVRETYKVGGKEQVRMRYAYASGGLMTPRSFNRSADPEGPIALTEEWRKAEVPNDPVATAANRRALMNTPAFFTRVVLGHVTESNPEYKRSSEFEKVYRLLADQYASTGKYPSTLDELVNDIASRVVMTSALPNAYVEEQLTNEINTMLVRFFNQYQTGTAKNQEELKKHVLAPDSMMTIMDSSNNFTKPRGEMIAPTNFYTYTLSSDRARGSLVNGAMLPLRMHQLKAMEDALAAVKNEQQQLIEDIKKSKIPNARATIRPRYLNGKGMLAGTARADLRRMDALISQLSTATQIYRSMIEKPVAGSGSSSFWEDMLQLRRIMLVASPVSAATNYLSAAAAGEFAPITYLQGYKPKVLVGLPITGVVKIVWNTAAYIASQNPAVAQWMQANKGTVIPLMRQFAETVDTIQRMKAIAAQAGFAPDELSIGERARIVREIGGYGSPVEGEGQMKSELTEALEKAFSKGWLPYLTLFFQNVPSMADRAANVITMMNIDSALNNVMRSGYQFIEARSKGVTPGWDNFTDPANSMTDDEAIAIGWNRETLIRLKQAFSGIGGLERVLHDYWQRVNAAKAANQNINDVQAINDPGFYKDVVTELLGMTNVPLDGMRPDVTGSRTALGGIYNFVFTFSSWINGWFSFLGNMLGTDPKRGTANAIAISALSLTLLMLTLAMSGMWANELRGLFYELVKGRPYPVMRMTDLGRDPSLASAAKLFGASAALMIPYAGEYIASALGAQNYRASLTDIANLSQPLQLMNTFKDAISNGMSTGDWTGTFLQTLRSTVPMTDIVVNRLPVMAGRDAVNDAVRVARVNAGPLELSSKSGGGQGAQPTRFSNLVKQAIGAQASGDTGKAQSLLQQAAEESASNGNKDPWGAVRSSLAAQSPETKTFGRKLTDSERSDLLGRMSSNQRDIYMKGTNAVQSLMGQVPSKAGGPKPVETSITDSNGRVRSPIERANRKFRSIRERATPRAMKVVQRKVKALKPKKLNAKIGKSSGGGGSRLLRPKARGSVASVRPPSLK